MRRIAILAEGAFEWHYGKTATGVIRYGKDTVVAVIDSTKAGMDVPQALGGAPFGHGIRLVRDIKGALTYSPDTLLIGIAPMGGALPAAWRWQLLTAIDAGLDLVSDFVAGMVEQMVLDFTNEHDWVFVEGQGALNHPGYSPVTLGLIHGSMPDAMIFCHLAGATAIEGYTYCPLPSLKRMIEFNEDTVSWVRPERPCKVAGLALVTFGLSEQAAKDAIKQAEDETGLPATDVLRFGAGVLMDALSKQLKA